MRMMPGFHKFWWICSAVRPGRKRAISKMVVPGMSRELSYEVIRRRSARQGVNGVG